MAAQDSLNGNWSYSYDEFNRLLTASGGGQGQSFDYDAYGNRWHENVTLGQAPFTQFSFDNSNRMIGSGVKYDTLGNVIDDGIHKYTYDAENRLVKVDLNPDGSSAASYAYDAFGQRVSKTAASAATEFLYDLAGRVIAERDAATGAWNRSEIYAGSRHLATYARNTTYFRHSDWLGSSRVKTLPDGTVAETCTNLPFGDGLTCTPGAGQSASPDLFAGYERDQETQLDHTWFRKYSSAQGRWTTPDPYLGSMDLAHPQSLNRYAYVLNNPVNLRDPLGLNCVWDDGSYDDDEDPVTGNQKGCENAGGTWYDYHVGMQDWSLTADGTGNAYLDTVTLLSELKDYICSQIPDGRTEGISLGVGFLGGQTGTFEIVTNFNTGEVSAFLYGGGQTGWNGGYSASAISGLIWNLGNSNANYSGPFTNLYGSGAVGLFLGNTSGGFKDPFNINPYGPHVFGGSIGVSGTPSGGGSVTYYSAPAEIGTLGKVGFFMMDPTSSLNLAGYVARQGCK
ncbi:MAG: RHS repeat-associated core domain-containing protein [Acidobacteriia bacterium]|nr:RHS repeat-associated core domain-containing protein [Terriglobia bacterium]